VTLSPPIDRRTLLGLLIAAIIPGFALTHTIVNRYRDGRQHLADEWSARGQRDLPVAAGAAVVDFETSLAYGPERTSDRLQLAEALIRADRPAEARAQLLTLWAEQPGSGPINLQLARLAAADGDVQESVRYYHAAIDGSWDTGATVARREARLELSKFLLANGQQTRAQSELIALTDDLPADSGLMTDVAGMLIDTGGDRRALVLLDRALALDPDNSTAAQLAGGIAFRQADYALARRYLLDAAKGDSALDPRAQEMLDVSREVLALDPYARGIRAAERARRATRALDVARERLVRCESASAAATTASDLDTRVAAATRVTERALARDTELVDDRMSLVFEIEKLQGASCGPPSPADRALLIIAAQRSGRPQ